MWLEIWIQSPWREGEWRLQKPRGCTGADAIYCNGVPITAHNVDVYILFPAVIVIWRPGCSSQRGYSIYYNLFLRRFCTVCVTKSPDTPKSDIFVVFINQSQTLAVLLSRNKGFIDFNFTKYRAGYSLLPSQIHITATGSGKIWDWKTK